MGTGDEGASLLVTAAISEKHTTPVRFAVLRVTCRHCGGHVPVEVDAALSPDEQLNECVRQYDASHNCDEKKFAELALGASFAEVVEEGETT